MEGVKIFEQELKDKNGISQGKIAIMYGGLDNENPKKHMDDAVTEYTNGKPHSQYVDIYLDNPWFRIVLSGVNDLNFEDFNKQKL
ncbi:MAG: hypothetical protein IJP79_09840 [Paludibacteraceae bacterium]|nr:hypothetical protein [Paludibacteraceae bacterium]